jgi:predicted ATPase/class 3 adenylate cyclase
MSHDPPAALTLLFTDIEGSTRLWEDDPQRMAPALAAHDTIVRDAIGGHRGRVVKTTGDGVHAVFGDARDALAATLAIVRALDDPARTAGVALKVRCGLHSGVAFGRDGDFYGSTVNRAARIMSAAHGGQILVSQAVAEQVAAALPAGCALLDLGQVRLRDLASPERVHQLTHPALRCEFPPLRSLAATPNNLPGQLTSFVGRSRELAEVRALLRTTRLLTLTGTGGLGKTRLSLQVAAEALDDYPDGVWFVELAPLTDPRRVVLAVASALNVKEEAGRPLQDTLAEHLLSRRLLLVLDNCEHLVQACAELVKALLVASPGLQVLASSRQPLHCAGETAYALAPLALPVEPGGSASMLAQCEATTLFVERAVAAGGAFTANDAAAAAVVEICRRLDGIPLAIELAAARVRELSVDRIAARIGQRFRLLTRGDPTALPRQQTLRALIDWSHDLLGEAEAILFRRLAVFAGGFTLDAVEVVGSDGLLPRDDVLDTLGTLVDKSLVTLEPGGERYRMLETMREYAGEKLVAAGEEDAVRRRHFTFYAGFADTARAGLFGTDQSLWLARLDVERENVLSAHAWCLAAPDTAEAGLGLAKSLMYYWILRGLLDLGYRVTREALAHPGAVTRGSARCVGLSVAGQIGAFMGRYAEARPLLEESLAIGRELGDDIHVVRVLQPLGLALLGLGDAAAARIRLTEALALARQHGNPRAIAAALNALAQTARVEGDLDTAEPLYVDMLALARKLGEPSLTASALLNLAMVAICRGTEPTARELLREAAGIARDIGSTQAAQSTLEVCAGLAASRAEWQQCLRFYGTADALARSTGLQRDPADQAFLIPRVEAARGALGVAAAAAEREGGARPYPRAIAAAEEWLAQLALPDVRIR